MRESRRGAVVWRRKSGLNQKAMLYFDTNEMNNKDVTQSNI